MNTGLVRICGFLCLLMLCSTTGLASQEVQNYLQNKDTYNGSVPGYDGLCSDEPGEAPICSGDEADVTCSDYDPASWDCRSGLGCKIEVNDSDVEYRYGCNATVLSCGQFFEEGALEEIKYKDIPPADRGALFDCEAPGDEEHTNPDFGEPPDDTSGVPGIPGGDTYYKLECKQKLCVHNTTVDCVNLTANESLCSIAPGCDYSEGGGTGPGFVENTARYLCADTLNFSAAKTEPSDLTLNANPDLATPGNDAQFIPANHNQIEGKIIYANGSTFLAENDEWVKCSSDGVLGGDREYLCYEHAGKRLLSQCCKNSTCVNMNSGRHQPLNSWSNYSAGGAGLLPGQSPKSLRVSNNDNNPFRFAGNGTQIFTMSGALQHTKDISGYVEAVVRLPGANRSEFQSVNITVQTKNNNMEVNVGSKSANPYPAGPHVVQFGDLSDIEGITIHASENTDYEVYLRIQSDGLSFCGHPDGKTWINDFESGSNDSGGETDIGYEAACKTVYGPHAWTGTRCCGDDTIRSVKEVYGDTKAGCYKGIPVGKGEGDRIVSEVTGVSEERYLLYTDTDSGDGEYHICDGGVTVSLRYGGSDAGTPADVGPGDEVGDFLCNPDLGWTRTTIESEIYDMTNVLLSGIGDDSSYGVQCRTSEFDSVASFEGVTPEIACAARSASDNKSGVLIKGDADSVRSVTNAYLQTRGQIDEGGLPEDFSDCDLPSAGEVQMRECGTYTTNTKGSLTYTVHHDADNNYTAITTGEFSVSEVFGSGSGLSGFFGRISSFFQGLFFEPASFTGGQANVESLTIRNGPTVGAVHTVFTNTTGATVTRVSYTGLAEEDKNYLNNTYLGDFSVNIEGNKLVATKPGRSDDLAAFTSGLRLS